MARPKKPTNYKEELERIEMRLTHHQNSIKELEDKRDEIIKRKSAHEMQVLSDFISQNNISASDIISQLHLSA
ncbi:MAG: hypothetical protein PUH11_02365 [Bacilli bacterium]|nr:hypothetical protein [Bacilli bacterium]